MNGQEQEEGAEFRVNATSRRRRNFELDLQLYTDSEVMIVTSFGLKMEVYFESEYLPVISQIIIRRPWGEGLTNNFCGLVGDQFLRMPNGQLAINEGEWGNSWATQVDE